MPHVVNKADPSRFFFSVSDTNFPTTTWLHNPPSLLTLWPNIPPRYWKLDATATDIEEMSAAEKLVVDTALNTQEVAANKVDALSLVDNNGPLKPLIRALLEVIVELDTRNRNNAPQPNLSQIVDFVKTRIQNG